MNLNMKKKLFSILSLVLVSSLNAVDKIEQAITFANPESLRQIFESNVILSKESKKKYLELAEQMKADAEKAAKTVEAIPSIQKAYSSFNRLKSPFAGMFLAWWGFFTAWPAFSDRKMGNSSNVYPYFTMISGALLTMVGIKKMLALLPRNAYNKIYTDSCAVLQIIKDVPVQE